MGHLRLIQLLHRQRRIFATSFGKVGDTCTQRRVKKKEEILARKVYERNSKGAGHSKNEIVTFCKLATNYRYLLQQMR